MGTTQGQLAAKQINIGDLSSVMEHYSAKKWKGVLTDTCYNIDEPLKNYKVKEARHRNHVFGLILYEMSRICRLHRQKIEYWLPGTWGMRN